MAPDYHRKLQQIGAALDALHREAAQLRRQMAGLEAQGIIDASEHWRKDRRGEKTILELVYSVHSERVKSGRRRIEYIGNKPGKIAAARQSMARFKQHSQLGAELKRIEDKITQGEGSIDSMLWKLKGNKGAG